MKSLKFIVIIFLCIGCVSESRLPELELYRVFELTMEAKNPGDNPYVDGPEVVAVFKGTSGDALGAEYKINGFWDGGNTWKIRFSPVKAGRWTFTTSSTDRGLNNIKGTLNAVQPLQDHLESNILYHGFLEKNDKFSWKLSDGTPFLPVGETQWSFSEEFSISEWKDWMDAIAEKGYNNFMGCVWLGKYIRFRNDPFANKDPKTDKLLVSFFKEKLDSMVMYANDKGIMMGLVIGGFPDNSEWFIKFPSIEQNDRWFKYIIARYSAYNVRWGLFGEMNEANGRFALEGKTWQWVGEHFARLIKENDPYKHPVGSHNTRVDTVAAANPDIDFIEVQEGDRKDPLQYLNAIRLRKWNKPVWYEEYWYEMDGDENTGIRNTHRNFINALTFPTMGSLMRYHKLPGNIFPPDEAAGKGISLKEYLLKNDTGMIRMKYFSDFYRVFASNLDEFVPATEKVSRGECGRFGKNFAVFLENGGNFEIDLSEEKGFFDVLCLDIKTGEVRNIGTTEAGKKQTINTGIKEDASVLLIHTAD